MARPTLSKIAEELNLSKCTISLALRDSNRVSLKTRKKVKETAKRLGYYSDPSISKLMTHIRSSKKRDELTPVALINKHRFAPFSAIDEYCKFLYEGMQYECDERGFQLVEFYLNENRMSDDRLNNILESRGIHGIIVAPSSETTNKIRLNWNNFSAVTIGYTLLEPRLNRIVGNQKQGILLSLLKLLELGHARIGIVLNSSADERMTFIASMVFKWFQELFPSKERIPALIADDLTPELLKSWINKHKPTAIVTHINHFDIILKKTGILAPQGVSIAYYGPQKTIHKDTSGSFVSPFDIGRSCINILESQLLRNQFGIPETATTSLIDMQWRSGKTTLNIGAPHPLRKFIEASAW